MSRTPAKPRTTASKKAAPATRKPPRSPRGPADKKSSPKPTQARARRKPAEKAPPPPVAPPRESATAAVERSLVSVESTPKRAVLIAQVRRLASAIDHADPPDVPKISRELSARWAELIADANPPGEPPDWTQQTAGTAS